MKKTSNRQLIINFIGKHPGCTFAEVIEGTDLLKSCVNSALCKLTDSKEIKRSGPKGNYTYTLPSWQKVVEPVRDFTFEFSPYFGCKNPMTNLFNECLAGVRK